MVYMYDLFTREEYKAGVADRFIAQREHPTHGLVIYNYTNRAQVTSGAWENPAVRQCRGLITDRHGQVIARPFEKFFNHNQPEAGTLDLSEPVRVYDKLDGSLGILYPTGSGRYEVASRGSFTSEQALHATEVWKSRYEGRWSPPPWCTALFEIIYPANRIVLDYGGFDNLVLLGFVHNTTGEIIGPSGEWSEWPGPKADSFAYPTLGEALNAPPRLGAEGFVIHLLRQNKLVKIKQEDYVVLHKAVFGLNERVVWERLSTSGDLKVLLGALPDELHGWVRSTAADLTYAFGYQRDEALGALEVLRSTGLTTDRKTFALTVQSRYSKEMQSLLFALLDGKDIDPLIWKQLRPGHSNGPVSERLEEAA